MDPEYIENSIHILKNLISTEYTCFKNHRILWLPFHSKNCPGSLKFDIDYVIYEDNQKWHVLETEYTVHIYSNVTFKIVHCADIPKNAQVTDELLNDLICKWLTIINPSNRQVIRTNLYRSELLTKVHEKEQVCFSDCDKMSYL